MIVLKLGVLDKAFVEDMALELWPRTWWLWERPNSLKSSVLWYLCIVEALWRHLMAFGLWGPTPFGLALLFVDLMGLSLLTLFWDFL